MIQSVKRKVTIYLSGTFDDLKEYRQAVIHQLQSMQIPMLTMEFYVSQEAHPVARCLEDVAASDLYIGLFAFRYGYIPSGHTRSITELEYREAGNRGIDRHVFLANADQWPPALMDSTTGEHDGGQRIASLREELSQTKTLTFFATPHELAAQVAAAAHIWYDNKYYTTHGGTRPSKGQTLHDYLQSCASQDEGLVAQSVPLEGLITLRKSEKRAGTGPLWPVALDAIATGVRTPSDDAPKNGIIEDLAEGLADFIILGEAGSGKTVTLRRLRHKYVRRAMMGAGRVPLLINMPEWPETVPDFRSLIAHERQVQGCPPIADRELLLLIDGLDEPVESTSIRYTSELTGWLRNHPDATCILAARVASAWTANAFAMSIVTVPPMTPAVTREVASKYVVPAKVEDLMSYIYRSAESGNLAALAANPFRLTVVCYIFDRLGPTTGLSYAQMMRYMLKALYQREVDTGRAALEGFPAFNNVVGRLALGMLSTKGKTAVQLDWVRKRLSEIEFKSASEIGRSIGLIELTKNGKVIKFSHGLFQIYCAADSLARDGRLVKEYVDGSFRKGYGAVDDDRITPLAMAVDLSSTPAFLELLANLNPLLAMGALQAGSFDRIIDPSTAAAITGELLKTLKEGRPGQLTLVSYARLASRYFPSAFNLWVCSNNPAIRRSATRIVGENAGPTDIPALLRLAASDNNRHVRKEAEDIVRRLCRERGDAVDAWLQSEGLSVIAGGDMALKFLDLMFDEENDFGRLEARLIQAGLRSEDYARWRAKKERQQLGRHVASRVASAYLAIQAGRRKHRYAHAPRVKGEPWMEPDVANDGLGDWIGWSQGAEPAVVKGLIEELSVVGPKKAARILRQLSRCGDAACSALLECLYSDSPTLRRRAPRVLGRLQYKKAQPRLIELLDDPNPRIAVNALRALGNMKDQSLAWLFQRVAFSSTNIDIVVSAMRALEIVGGQEAETTAERFLYDGREEVRFAALRLLRCSYLFASSAQATLLDEVARVRHLGLDWMISHDPVQGFRAIIDLLGKALPENTHVARVGAALIILINDATPHVKELVRLSASQAGLEEIASYIASDVDDIVSALEIAVLNDVAAEKQIAELLCLILEFSGKLEHYLQNGALGSDS